MINVIILILTLILIIIIVIADRVTFPSSAGLLTFCLLSHFPCKIYVASQTYFSQYLEYISILQEQNILVVVSSICFSITKPNNAVVTPLIHPKYLLRLEFFKTAGGKNCSGQRCLAEL